MADSNGLAEKNNAVKLRRSLKQPEKSVVEKYMPVSFNDRVPRKSLNFIIAEGWEILKWTN